MNYQTKTSDRRDGRPFSLRTPHSGTPAFRNFAAGSGRGDGSRRSAVPRRAARTAPGAAAGAAKAKRGREHLRSRTPTARPPLSKSPRQRGPRAAIVCEAPPPRGTAGPSTGLSRDGAVPGRGSRRAETLRRGRERRVPPGAQIGTRRGGAAEPRAPSEGSGDRPPARSQARAPTPGFPALPSEPLSRSPAPPLRLARRGWRQRSAPRGPVPPQSSAATHLLFLGRGGLGALSRHGAAAAARRAGRRSSAQHSAPPPPHKMAAARRTAGRRDHTSSALSLPLRGATRPAPLGGNFRCWPRPPLRHADFRAPLGYRECCCILP